MNEPWADLPAISDVAGLAAYGVPIPSVRDKVLTELAGVHLDWIAASPLVLVATSSTDGRCDVSPKGDPAGSVKALDATTLVLPERSGNRRMDGFANIVANPHVGLLFVIPGRNETLRVNGEARILTDGPFFDDLVVRGHRPELALMLKVEEAFFHCPKAFMRGGVWAPESWEPEAVMSYAEIAKRLWRSADPPEEVDAYYATDRYTAGLYPRSAL